MFTIYDFYDCYYLDLSLSANQKGVFSVRFSKLGDGV